MILDSFKYKHYEYIDEFVLILDTDSKIIYQNKNSIELFKTNEINSILHQFTFDICILKEEKLATFSPITAALESNENFYTEALLQISSNNYKNVIIKAFNIDNLRHIIISDITPKIKAEVLANKNNELNMKITKLESLNDENNKLKNIAESLATRAVLVNKIANSIKDILNFNEIISLTMHELNNVLGASECKFFNYNPNNNSWEEYYSINKNNAYSNNDETLNEISSSMSIISSAYLDKNDSNKIKSRIIAPIKNSNELKGAVVILDDNSNKKWHTDEIELIESISTLLSTAIKQISLFNEIEKQKEELQKTLKELKETQTHLIQSEKMASLGQLVAGVAHEINTPLGSMNCNNDMISKCLHKIKNHIENSDTAINTLKMLENINTIDKEAISRVNEIVKSLKNFARLDESEQKQANIHEGIKNTISLIHHEIKNRVKVTTDFSDIPEVNCYPNLLNQVFMNILVNASQSIKGAGEIHIKTYTDINNIVIEFKDSGEGINKENINKIFDPGFTTKGVGVGTGLGLSICYQIIEKHKGEIKVESEIGKGTTFKVYIPKIFT